MSYEPSTVCVANKEEENYRIFELFMVVYSNSIDFLR